MPSACGSSILTEAITSSTSSGPSFHTERTTSGAIRTVVRAAATRDGVEVDVDFVD